MLSSTAQYSNVTIALGPSHRATRLLEYAKEDDVEASPPVSLHFYTTGGQVDASLAIALSIAVVQRVPGEAVERSNRDSRLHLHGRLSSSYSLSVVGAQAWNRAGSSNMRGPIPAKIN